MQVEDATTLSLYLTLRDPPMIKQSTDLTQRKTLARDHARTANPPFLLPGLPSVLMLFATEFLACIRGVHPLALRNPHGYAFHSLIDSEPRRSHLFGVLVGTTLVCRFPKSRCTPRIVLHSSLFETKENHTWRLMAVIGARGKQRRRRWWDIQEGDAGRRSVGTWLEGR